MRELPLGFKVPEGYRSEDVEVKAPGLSPEERRERSFIYLLNVLTKGRHHERNREESRRKSNIEKRILDPALREQLEKLINRELDSRGTGPSGMGIIPGPEPEDDPFIQSRRQLQEAWNRADEKTKKRRGTSFSDKIKKNLR